MLVVYTHSFFFFSQNKTMEDVQYTCHFSTPFFFSARSLYVLLLSNLKSMKAKQISNSHSVSEDLAVCPSNSRLCKHQGYFFLHLSTLQNFYFINRRAGSLLNRHLWSVVVGAVSCKTQRFFYLRP
jgi:hypothetical protein